MAHKERSPPPSGLIFHSDRGAQYTSHRFQQLLHEHHAKQSFSHPGKPHDNAVAESFFASLKKEELYRKALPSDRAFQASVASYINFLDTKRPHCTLKNLTQCQMEENFIVDTKWDILVRIACFLRFLLWFDAVWIFVSHLLHSTNTVISGPSRHKTPPPNPQVVSTCSNWAGTFKIVVRWSNIGWNKFIK